MADFPVDEAQIIALFMESLFYGLYLVSFGMCMYIMLVKSRSQHRQRIIFLIVAILLFIVATLDVALLLRHVLDAFIWYHGPGGPNGEFSDISYWVNAMKSANYVIQTSIGDAVLIYRCYLVYKRNWKVVAPLCLLWVGGLVTEGFNIYIEFTLHTSALLNASELQPFITSVLSLTLVLNVVATSMIVYKIWSIERRSRQLLQYGGLNGDSSLRRAIRIIVESGLMYTAGVVCFFVVYLASNNSQYGVSDCVVQIIGISFNLIIIRIDQGKTIETVYAPQTLHSDETSDRFTSANSRRQRLVFKPPTATDMTTAERIGQDHSIAMISLREESGSGYDKFPHVSDVEIMARKVEPLTM